MGDVPNTMPHTEEKTKSPWPNRIKAACFVTTAGFFGLGLRAAYKQAKPLDPQDLTKMKLMSGVGFASKALGIATLLTVSGFSLFVVGISALLDVNTPRQFGHKVRGAFGDKFRIAGSGSGESYESLSELFEVANKTKPEKKDETTN
ncbi:unnamed protein product [Bursaphelenchus xylophilus]|uniref:(pine wood nematode) hypothetical protein n=1 Tax=Bursaphelenchus xylophilus TaxID=6326 RepID=A0A1I7RLJ5_BURXY|nr:unnamed protein product [Bursaphelenchus xylophilus]CAG9082917.1 unnamed protein product [Bursaphelenchus xylophilus]